METFSALLALCAGNSPVTGEFPTQRPVTRSFDILFDLRLNKRLSKLLLGWWFKTTSSLLWRQYNAALKSLDYKNVQGNFLENQLQIMVKQIQLERLRSENIPALSPWTNFKILLPLIILVKTTKH